VRDRGACAVRWLGTQHASVLVRFVVMVMSRKEFLLDEEKIVFTGLITKKKSVGTAGNEDGPMQWCALDADSGPPVLRAPRSLFSLDRKRQLILTSLPRFVYVDPEAMVYKKVRGAHMMNRGTMAARNEASYGSVFLCFVFRTFRGMKSKRLSSMI
jgi:hypothetical protein